MPLLLYGQIKRGQRPFPYGKSRRLCCSLESPDPLAENYDGVNQQADTGEAAGDSPEGTAEAIHRVGEALVHVLAQSIRTRAGPVVRMSLAVVTNSGNTCNPSVNGDENSSSSLNDVSTAPRYRSFPLRSSRSRKREAS